MRPASFAKSRKAETRFEEIMVLLAAGGATHDFSLNSNILTACHFGTWGKSKWEAKVSKVMVQSSWKTKTKKQTVKHYLYADPLLKATLPWDLLVVSIHSPLLDLWKHVVLKPRAQTRRPVSPPVCFTATTVCLPALLLQGSSGPVPLCLLLLSFHCCLVEIVNMREAALGEHVLKAKNKKNKILYVCFFPVCCLAWAVLAHMTDTHSSQRNTHPDAPLHALHWLTHRSAPLC